MTEEVQLLPHRIRGTATIIQAAPSITIGHGDEQLRITIDHLAEKGFHRVVLDMEGTRVDAAGLGEIVRSYTTITHRHRGIFSLAAPTDKVKNLLAITRLDSHLTVYDSVKEAVDRIV